MMTKQPTDGGCWAIACGGTRRAYLAVGGSLSHDHDLPAYTRWLMQMHQHMCEYLYELGVTTLLIVERLPVGRGDVYDQVAQHAVHDLIAGPDRLTWYRDWQLRVAVAAGRYPHLHTVVQEVTAHHTGPQLIYLFREPTIVPGMEELEWGLQLAQRLGRMPTRDEVIQDYYGMPVPLLHVYVGSGRPRLTNLRPPWLGGAEDYYWTGWSPVLLTKTDWQRIGHDHRELRPTDSNRGYTPDDQSVIQHLYRTQPRLIVGLGQRESGWWRSVPPGEES